MPFFPFNFPYVFGEKLVEAQQVSVVAAPSAVASVTKLAECSLNAYATTSGAAQKDARVDAVFDVTASPSGQLERTTFGSASTSVDAGPGATSQELGFAEASNDVLVSPSGTLSREQSLTADLAGAFEFSAVTDRSATFASFFEATATNTGYYGNPTAIAPAPAGTFIDTFNFEDTSRWAGWSAGVSVVGGQLVQKLNGSGIYSISDRNSGSGVLNLNNHQIALHLVSPPTGDSTALARFFIRPTYSFNSVQQSAICIEFSNGNWRFVQYGPDGTGSATTTPYSSGEWVRVRVDSGIVYWDISADGLHWSNERDEPLLSSGYGAAGIGFESDANGGSGAAEAIWDSLNAEPRAIQASFAAFAEANADGSRGQFISSSLSAVAVQDGANRYDAAAQSSLSLDMFLTGELMKTLNAVVSLSLSADVESMGTEFGIADTDTAAVVDTAGVIVSDQIISAFTEANFIASGFASRGQGIDSDSFVVCVVTSDGQCIYRSGVSLSAFAFPAATGLRDAAAATSFAAEVESGATATEFGLGDAAFAATALATGALSKAMQIDTSAYVAFMDNPPSEMSANRLLAGALQAQMYSGAAIDEPLLIVGVPVDLRIADVDDSARGASVSSDDRRAIVKANKQRV